MITKIQIHFRFLIEQDGPQSALLCVNQEKDGIPLLNPAAAKRFNLSDGEIDAAEAAALLSIAVVR